jgi:hypothetical protein
MCSDCRAPLVAAKEDAGQRAVASVWSGGNKSAFEIVLDTLRDAEIPLHFRERTNIRGAARATFRNMAADRPEVIHDTEFEVKVLACDAGRAEKAIREALIENREVLEGPERAWFRYCPLCKAEYRAAFSECSDCHIPLVASEAEAEQTRVDCLWKGNDRKRCERILDALLAAKIPFRSKESVKARPWMSIAFWRIRKPQPAFEFEIRVLHRDLTRATAAVPPVPKNDWHAEEKDEQHEKPALT